jgi:sialate O-acetylesterase
MRHFLSLCVAVFTIATACCVRADVKLPPIFGDHMVLAKTAKVPIWGKADPGETVTVTLDGQTARTQANAEGKWMTSLNLKDSAPGPFEMTVAGNNRLIRSDVVVGEVWLASGQSNMEFRLANTLDAQAEIAGSANPLLRQFLVAHVAKLEAQEEVNGTWVAASPQTAGSFSGVGYYFAKKLQHELQVPLGLVHASWGGTWIESWTSTEALDSVPDLKHSRERDWALLNGYPAKKRAFVEGMTAWIKATSREDRPVSDAAAYAGVDVSSEGWIPVKIPGPVLAPGLPEAGAVWLRKEIMVPAENSRQFVLRLALDGYHSVYWNGKLLKTVTYQDFEGLGTVYSSGAYVIPLSDIRQGKNVLSVRFYEPVAPARINTVIDINSGAISLAGEWLAKAEYVFPALDARVTATPPPPLLKVLSAEHVGAGLFNGMIYPLVPYAISGVIWYQGEGNTGRSYQYRTAFPLLITDWRKHWGQGDIPFYFCQLSNYLEKKAAPESSKWAELREAQSMALQLPNTGQAVLLDLGDSRDIHPRNKWDPGDRLARIALARDYGKPIPYSGPVYDGMKAAQGKIFLSFKHTDGGLVARALPATYSVISETKKVAPLVRNSPASELEGFEICGEDKKWVWADAKIEGDYVVVWSNTVPAPIAVRYAWADNPTGNLYNGADLPASPFRTDDFTPVTVNVKY